MNSPSSKSQFSWLKVIGALAVLWMAAKVIGTLLSPGVIALAIVIWLIVRSQRNKAQRPVAVFVPGSVTVPYGTPAVQAMSAPFVPVQNMPFQTMPVQTMPVPANHSPQQGQPIVHSFVPQSFVPQSVVPQPVQSVQSVQPVFDARTPEEREIEEYVQRSWPNV